MASSCEAEIAAMFYGSSELVWIRNILSEFGYRQSSPTFLDSDNQGAIKWSQNRDNNGRMKHINVKFFFVRERIEASEIQPRYLPGVDNPADILTKSVPPKTFIKHRNYFGVLPRSIEC